MGYAPNDLEHLTVKGNLYILIIYPRGTNLAPFALRPTVFEIQGCWKSEDAPNDFTLILNTLTVNNLSALHMYIQQWLTPGTQILLGLIMTNHFRDTRLSKIPKCTEWHQNYLKHINVKSTLYPSIIYPWGTNFLCFALRPTVFKIQGCTRSNVMVSLDSQYMVSYY